MDLFQIGFGADASGFERGDFLFEYDGVVAGSGVRGGMSHRELWIDDF